MDGHKSDREYHIKVMSILYNWRLCEVKVQYHLDHNYTTLEKSYGFWLHPICEANCPKICDCCIWSCLLVSESTATRQTEV